MHVDSIKSTKMPLRLCVWLFDRLDNCVVSVWDNSFYASLTCLPDFNVCTIYLKRSKMKQQTYQ